MNPVPHQSGEANRRPAAPLPRRSAWCCQPVRIVLPRPTRSVDGGRSPLSFGPDTATMSRISKLMEKVLSGLIDTRLNKCEKS
jgi:hypothetical protein